MTEAENKTERTEAAAVQKTPEAAAVLGVISGQSNQEIHGQAFTASHANDHRPSSPELIATKDGETLEEYKARVETIQNNPFVLVDSQASAEEVVLIAQAAPSSERGLPGDVVNGVWNAAVGTSESINRHFNTVHIPQGATMDYLSGIVKNQEKYDEYFQKYALNKSACEAAYKAFGLDKREVDKDLIASLIWNEQLHRKPTDTVQDLAVLAGAPLKGSESIGPGQMQIRNIDALVLKYPGLKEFGDPHKAALDPAKAPFFVAAYLSNEADKIEEYNKSHSIYAGFQSLPINTDSLAYRYNPDVYREGGLYRSLEPWEKMAVKVNMLEGVLQQEWPLAGVVENSHHVRKVRAAMAEVKAHR